MMLGATAVAAGQASGGSLVPGIFGVACLLVCGAVLPSALTHRRTIGPEGSTASTPRTGVLHASLALAIAMAPTLCAIATAFSHRWMLVPAAIAAVVLLTTRPWLNSAPPLLACLLLAPLAAPWLATKQQWPLLLGLAAIVTIVWAARAAGFSQTQLAAFVLASLALYVCANVIAYAAGLRSPTADSVTVKLTNTIPLFANRIHFPLSTGWTDPAYTAGATVVAIVVLLRQRIFTRVALAIMIPTLASATIVLAGADGRMALLVTAGGTLLALIWPRALRFVAPTAIGLAMILPIWWTPVGRSIDPALNTLSFLKRRSSENIAELFGRREVWSGVKDTLAGSSPPHLIFGWGRNGQVSSGASQHWAERFKGVYAEPTQTSAHNSWLQQWLDHGLILSTYLVAVVIVVALLLARASARSRWLLALYGAFFVLALSSAIEIVLSPGEPDAIFWLFVLVAAVSDGGSYRRRRARHRAKSVSTLAEQTA